MVLENPYVKEISEAQCEKAFEELRKERKGRDDMTVRGLRGATTVENDEEQAVLEATEALVEEMAKENGVFQRKSFRYLFLRHGYQIDISSKSSPNN